MIILIKSNSYPQGYIIKKEADTHLLKEFIEAQVTL